MRHFTVQKYKRILDQNKDKQERDCSILEREGSEWMPYPAAGHDGSVVGAVATLVIPSDFSAFKENVLKGFCLYLLSQESFLSSFVSALI